MRLYAGGMGGPVVDHPVSTRTPSEQSAPVDDDRQVLVNVAQTIVEISPRQIDRRSGCGRRNAVGIAKVDRSCDEIDGHGRAKPRMPAELHGHVVTGVNGESHLEAIVRECDVVNHRGVEGPGFDETSRQGARRLVPVIDVPPNVVDRSVNGVWRAARFETMFVTAPPQDPVSKTARERHHRVQAPVERIGECRIGRHEKWSPVESELSDPTTPIGIDEHGCTMVPQLDHRRILSRTMSADVRLWHHREVRALVQRVEEASVVSIVDDVATTTGTIGAGLVVLLGVTHTDDAVKARKMADKIWNLRIMDDENGVMNLSIRETTTSVLVVSQFTLYGDTSGGRRPSWTAAARPDVAEPLVTAFVEELRRLGAHVETGRFRTQMKVSLVNDGPATVLVEI